MTNKVSDTYADGLELKIKELTLERNDVIKSCEATYRNYQMVVTENNKLKHQLLIIIKMNFKDEDMDEVRKGIRTWLWDKERTEYELIEKFIETIETSIEMTNTHNTKVPFDLLFKPPTLETILNKEKYMEHKYVIVRTYSAGVFAGFLESRTGQEVVLTNARRLWYWKGAASLSQLAMEGVKYPDECKFPIAVSRVELLQAIEILDVTPEAKASIESVKIWKE